MRFGGPWEIALILVIVLIIFGVGKLPQIGGAVGKGIRQFRRAQRGEDDGDEDSSKMQEKANPGTISHQS